MRVCPIPMPDEINTPQEEPKPQAPVASRQGGNGLGTIVAALSIAAAAIYAINVWSTARKETAPGRNLEQGIARIKDAASKAAAERQ